MGKGHKMSSTTQQDGEDQVSAVRKTGEKYQRGCLSTKVTLLDCNRGVKVVGDHTITEHPLCPMPALTKGRRSSPEQNRAPAVRELVSGAGDRQLTNT